VINHQRRQAAKIDAEAEPFFAAQRAKKIVSDLGAFGALMILHILWLDPGCDLSESWVVPQ